FGDPLFVRTPRGITPTPRALALTGPVKRVLADIEQLLTPTDFDPASAAFTVSVAATDYALRAVVAPFIAALRPRAPGIRVAVRPMDEADMQARMERGELDLALLTPESAPPDLHSRRLFDESYVCVLRAGHPQGASPLDLDSFCALDHAIVSLQGGGFSGATDAALAQLGRTRRVMVSVPSFVMLLDLIRSTDLAALVPRRLLTDLQGLQALEAPLPIPGFTKLLTWHPRTHDDPGHRWVRGVMAEVCGVGDTPG
ncbi:MAG: LysR substrate-binding domain-containing protein, partial [Rhodocyclales bacterium]|nr:LysR substrate-binding domain-containing protein [Rhodocyclales bacterium]